MKSKNSLLYFSLGWELSYSLHPVTVLGHSPPLFLLLKLFPVILSNMKIKMSAEIDEIRHFLGLEIQSNQSL